MKGPFTCLTFINPNKKREVRVVAGTITAFDYNKPTECNVLYLAGGGVMPVSESLDEIQQKLESINGQAAQGENNGREQEVRRTPVNVRKPKARKKG